MEPTSIVAVAVAESEMPLTQAYPLPESASFLSFLSAIFIFFFAAQPAKKVAPVRSYDEEPCAGDFDDEERDETGPAVVQMTAEVFPQFDVISTEAHQLLLSSLTIRAPAVEAEFMRKHRLGTDLVLVVDTSGSMAYDSKLETVCATLEFVIEELGPKDRVSIIEFDSKAKMLCGLRRTTLEGKMELVRIVNGLTAKGDTALLSGVEIALDVLRTRKWQNPTATIMVFTDGMDNGFEAEKDSRLAEAQFRKQFMSALNSGGGDDATIYTFGFGTNHCASLLETMASLGQGMFYYVPDADAFPTTAGMCLGSVLTAVVKNIEIKLESQDLAVAVLRGVTARFPAIDDGPAHYVFLPTLASGERRDVLFATEFAAGKDVPLPGPVLVTVGYEALWPPRERDVVDGSYRSGIRRVPASELPKDRKATGQCDYQINRVTTASAMRAASELAGEGNLVHALIQLRAAAAAISASGTRDAPECVKMVEDLRTAESKLTLGDWRGRDAQHWARAVALSHSLQRGISPDSAYSTPSQRIEAGASQEFVTATLTKKAGMRRTKRRRVDLTDFVGDAVAPRKGDEVVESGVLTQDY